MNDETSESARKLKKLGERVRFAAGVINDPDMETRREIGEIVTKQFLEDRRQIKPKTTDTAKPKESKKESE